MGFPITELNVLVVDDVQAVQTQIRDILRKYGFTFERIFLASNGEEAKAQLKDHEIHLILLDWHMTPTNGLEVLKFIRSHQYYKGIVCIMVTADTLKDSVLSAVKAGIDDFIVKPFTMERVEAKVHPVLVKKGVI